MKTYHVFETITQTITTQYEVEAKSDTEALEKFKGEGKICGSWEGGKDGIEIKEIIEQSGPWWIK